LRGENGDTAVGISMDDKNIKLYAVSTCGHCKTLKKMLEKERFVFDICRCRSPGRCTTPGDIGGSETDQQTLFFSDDGHWRKGHCRV
jgi:hypothetical protein